MSLTELKARCQQSSVPCWVFQGRLWCLPSSRSYRPPTCLAHASVFHVCSQQQWVEFSPGLPSIIALTLPSTFMDLCDYTGPLWTFQNNLPIARSLTESHLQSISQHVKFSVNSQVSGIRMWTSLGGREDTSCQTHEVKKGGKCHRRNE